MQGISRPTRFLPLLWLRFLGRISPLAAVVIIISLALIVRLSLAFWLHYPSEPLSGEIRRLAANLATTGEFANPYICTTGRSAHTVPGFPLLMSILMRIWPEGYARETALIALGSLATGIVYGILPLFAKYVGLPYQLGFIAGALGAILPVHGWLEARGVWEAPYVAIFLLGILSSFCSLAAQPNLAKAAGAGLLCGIGFYFGPQLLPVFIVLCASCLVIWRIRPLFPIAAMVVGLLITVPWNLRNYYALGKWSFMRDNLGLELSVAYSDITSPTFLEVNSAGKNGKPHGWTFHPCDQPKECALVQQMGESRYFSYKFGQAVQWIRQNPYEAVRLTGLHMLYFWFPRHPSAVHVLVSDMMTLVGIWGLIGFYRLNRPTALVLLLSVVSFSAIYALTIADSRYRYPIYPVLLFFNVVAVWRLLGFSIPQRQEEKW